MQCLNGEQVNIKDSVLRANISHRLDDDAARARAEQLADMGKAPIDLVSDDESCSGHAGDDAAVAAQGAKRGRSSGDADERAPNLTRGTGFCPWMDTPLDVSLGLGPAMGARASSSSAPKAKAKAASFAKTSRRRPGAATAAAKRKPKVTLRSEV